MRLAYGAAPGSHSRRKPSSSETRLMPCVLSHGKRRRSASSVGSLPLVNREHGIPDAVQPLDDRERHSLDLRVVDHERIGREAQVHARRGHPLLLELAVEKREGIGHDSRAAPLRVVTDAPMVPGHQIRVAGVAAAVTTAQDVVDAVEPEAALVEQALPLDGSERLLGGFGHGLHSLGRSGGLLGNDTSLAARSRWWGGASSARLPSGSEPTPRGELLGIGGFGKTRSVRGGLRSVTVLWRGHGEPPAGAVSTLRPAEPASRKPRRQRFRRPIPNGLSLRAGHSAHRHCRNL